MLKLVQVNAGVFDLAFDDPALNDVDAAVTTLIYGVLFTDAEAPVDHIQDRFDRRGWWSNPQAGSGLWHVRRQPLGSAARSETLAMIANALSKSSLGLTGVQVTELTGSAGNVSSVFIQVIGQHNGRQFIVKVPL